MIHEVEINSLGILKQGVPPDSVLGPLLFPIQISDETRSINLQSKHIHFAGNTSIIILHPEIVYF
jgi:hypothetical protein